MTEQEHGASLRPLELPQPHSSTCAGGQEHGGRNEKGRAAGNVNEDVLMLEYLQKGCQQVCVCERWLLFLDICCKPGRGHVVVVRWAAVNTWEFEIGLIEHPVLNVLSA